VISIAKTRIVGLILCEPFEKGGSTMRVFEAVTLWLDYHKSNSREKTLTRPAVSHRSDKKGSQGNMTPWEAIIMEEPTENE
jgi:hypothetical protein